jgi:hypothetical protein
LRNGAGIGESIVDGIVLSIRVGIQPCRTKDELHLAGSFPPSQSAEAKLIRQYWG